jgi:23S rRNA (adenine2030-N6)-methyltransferase
MNYRHAFPAGNFADLIKHAILTRLLRDLTAAPAPLTVIDTHAGAGIYDLKGDAAVRTGEGEAGVGRLMTAADTPAVFGDLKAAVRRVNRPGQVRYYPGSPIVVAGLLRPRDRYTGCELRPDDFAALKQSLPRELSASVHRADGWAHAAAVAPPAPASLLVLIDPPYEQGDDYAQAVALLGRLVHVNPRAVVAIWAPVKDLATWDAFLGEVEDTAAGRAFLVAEVRLRPLCDPMRMNGCAIIVVNPSPGLKDGARAAAEWIAATIGEEGAHGRAVLFGPG